jgi:hypothetical protein
MTYKVDAQPLDKGWFFIVAKIMYVNLNIGIKLHASL